MYQPIVPLYGALVDGHCTKDSTTGRADAFTIFVILKVVIKVLTSKAMENELKGIDLSEIVEDTRREIQSEMK